MNRSGLAIAIAALAAALGCCAQDAPPATKPAKPKAPTGSITGTVYCADSNLPARLAEIYLVQVSKDSNSSQGEGSTDLDGRFTVNRVAEGKYFVVAILPGYLNLLGTLTGPQFEATTPEDRARLEARIPSVTVSASQPAEISIRLERAAEIDGTVLYDDGSPAASLMVNKRPRPLNPARPSDGMSAAFDNGFDSFTHPVMTDDRGRFRILGVAPGEYLVSVNVPTAFADRASTNPMLQAMGSPLTGGLIVYAGGSFRAGKAKVIKIASGETSADADITIPLSKLHTIRGHVVLKSTGQPPPSAVVELLYADTKQPARMTMVPGGDFEIRYVPEDNYLVQAVANSEPLPKMDIPDDNEAGDGTGGALVSTGFAFSVRAPSAEPDQAAELPLLLTGDVDDLNIIVPDPPADQPHNPSVVVDKETTDDTTPVTPP